jgi:hypothetical protein
MDGAVVEVEDHAFAEEVSEGNGLGEYRAAIAVFAGQQASAVPGGEPPELEFLGLHCLFKTLRQRDFVEKPVSCCGVGHVFRAVREEDTLHQRVAIPVLRTGELVKVCGIVLT